jgi:hypothetical protein
MPFEIVRDRAEVRANDVQLVLPHPVTERESMEEYDRRCGR